MFKLCLGYSNKNLYKLIVQQRTMQLIKEIILLGNWYDKRSKKDKNGNTIRKLMRRSKIRYRINNKF